MKVATHVAYGNASLKCPACTAPGAEALRDMDGCDLEQRFGVPTVDSRGQAMGPYVGRMHRMAITCTVCAGRSSSCAVCGGGGEERVFQCPGTVCDADTTSVMRAYGDYKNGILPDEGGMHVQAAQFVDLMRVVDAELAALNAEARRNAKAKKPNKRG